MGLTRTPEEFVWMNVREIGMALACGVQTAHFDIHGGYYEDPAILDGVKRLGEIRRAAVAEDRSSAAEILVLVDEYSSHFVRFRNPADTPGTFLSSQAAFPHLQASRHGRIINISSLAGRTGGVTVGLHYSASKGGVISMTKALARMLAPSGGTANCIAPGPLDTPMTADWPAENREMLRQQIPLGRLGRAEDVAATALHLASDAGAFITGATLDVNGGIAML
jgi:NAD(P)-dependent dehydrogenase (short-subunit alcohol dehydrogenase family)